MIETFPYQVSLQVNGGHMCGASIISANWIVTAGHCVDFETEYMTVRAGTSFSRSGGTIHKVKKVIRHEKYYTNEYGVPLYDIAVISVKKPFKFGDSRQPINLFKKAEKSKAGVKSIITGWGSTGSGSPSQLQTVTVPIITKKLCNDAYKNYGGIPKGQICAAYYGEGGKDACQGDSGGPLAIDGRLAGIVSWGNGCADPDYPGVYTEIAHYRDWIKKHVKF